MGSIKAIETEYNGYRFRSQLEARWAYFFDLVGIPYIYELDGYRLADGRIWYRPDFWLPKHRMYVEIKPFSPNRAELDKAYYLSLEQHRHVIILCGDPFGLMEAHQYSYYPYMKEAWDLVWPALKDPEMFSQIEHVSEECMVFYQKGNVLHFYIGLDYDSLVHARSANDAAEFLVQFELGDKRSENDVVWELIKEYMDWEPDVSALIPDEALKARMYQFWKPRNK